MVVVKAFVMLKIGKSITDETIEGADVAGHNGGDFG